jgi:hypothetical protein
MALKVVVEIEIDFKTYANNGVLYANLSVQNML